MTHGLSFRLFNELSDDMTDGIPAGITPATAVIVEGHDGATLGALLGVCGFNLHTIQWPLRASFR